MPRKASDTDEQYLEKLRARRARTAYAEERSTEKRQYVTDALMTLKLVKGNKHD